MIAVDCQCWLKSKLRRHSLTCLVDKFLGMEPKFRKSKSSNPFNPKFKTGDVFITRNALAKIGFEESFKALARHASGDWGEPCEADRKANELALKDGSRLLSVYWTASDIKFYIITEADRSHTTVLLPEDY